MNKRLLKAKHWQIFLLIFGFAIVVPVVVLMLLNSVSKDLTSVLLTYGIFIYLLSVFLFVVGILVWLWVIGIGLQPKIPKEFSMKVGVFKVILLICIIYTSSPLIFMVAFMGDTQLADVLLNYGFLILPLHFLIGICFLYVLYFAAKTYKTTVLQRKATFSDFAGEFFLIWFFPIGIWIVQPKINELVSE